jgi:hypothetical protein
LLIYECNESFGLCILVVRKMIVSITVLPILFLDTLANLQDRDSYWKMMHKYIGSDVTSLVTLPVIIFEPMTMLQKMAEVCTAKF